MHAPFKLGKGLRELEANSRGSVGMHSAGQLRWDAGGVNARMGGGGAILISRKIGERGFPLPGDHRRILRVSLLREELVESGSIATVGLVRTASPRSPTVSMTQGQWYQHDASVVTCLANSLLQASWNLCMGMRREGSLCSSCSTGSRKAPSFCFKSGLSLPSHGSGRCPSSLAVTCAATSLYHVTVWTDDGGA